jgi:ribosome maturation factor RimP
MKKNRVEELVYQLAEPVAAGIDLELVDVEYVRERDGWYLRIYIDKETGVGLDDCEKMSRAIEKILDDQDPIPHSYRLEVSSPGIERPLVRSSDFLKYKGKRVLIKTYNSIDGSKKFDGTLLGLEQDIVVIEVSGKTVKIPIEGISKANLVFEW